MSPQVRPAWRKLLCRAGVGAACLLACASLRLVAAQSAAGETVPVSSGQEQQQGAQAAPVSLGPGSAAPAPSAQTPAAAAPNAAGSTQSPATAAGATDDKTARTKEPTSKDKRRAANLYLVSSRLFSRSEFEAALKGFKEAAQLDSTNRDYPLAVEVARGHAVMALIQQAVQAHIRFDRAEERAALAHALELDPTNAEVAEHMNQLAGEEAAELSKPIYGRAGANLGDQAQVPIPSGQHTFHLKTGQRQVIQQVFKGFGIDATLDDSVQARVVRLDIENANFAQTIRALSLLTNTFYIPLDPHRVLVARDTPDNRQKLLPQELETIYLPGLSNTELTDLGNLARNVFEVTQVVPEQSQNALVVRAPHKTLVAINETLRNLIEGRDQVLLEVRLIQLAHTSDRNTGAQLPQSLTAFNVYTEEQQILNSNSSLVQQIISSGLAGPNDIAAIIAILIASGQVSNALFSNGFALFGGGTTLSGLSLPTLSANLSLNSSDSRELDQLQLRLGDGEAGTIRSGEKYPIMTSSYSSLGTTGLNIPGLTGPGSSSGLGGIASELGLGSTTGVVPQVQYQDLGFTLKVTPKVLRSGQVALTFDLKIDALGGTSLNGVPILDNRAYTGVATLPNGESIALLSEIDKQQSRAISGVPGLSEIPGLNDVTDKDTQKSYASLLVVVTPHIVRSTQPAGHTPMMRIETRNRPQF